MLRFHVAFEGLGKLAETKKQGSKLPIENPSSSIRLDPNLQVHMTHTHIDVSEHVIFLYILIYTHMAHSNLRHIHTELKMSLLGIRGKFCYTTVGQHALISKYCIWQQTKHTLLMCFL